MLFYKELCIHIAFVNLYPANIFVMKMSTFNSLPPIVIYW